MGSSEKTIFKDRIIVSKPDLADQWPSWSGVGIRSGLKKNRGSHDLRWPGWPSKI
jgi:hypothetical protein